MTARAWGDPSSSTYERRYQRIVRADDIKFKTHREIAPLVKIIIDQAIAAGRFIDDARSYPDSDDGLSVWLKLKPDEPDLVAQVMVGAGFIVDGESFRWEQGIERTREIIEQAVAEVIAANVADDDEPPTEGEPYRGALAVRDLKLGDRGDDVYFIQMLLGYPMKPTGRFDKMTEKCVKRFQSVLGIEETGVVDNAVWRGIFPRIVPRMQQGDGGFKVRVLTAALEAKDWNQSAGIESRFGVRLAKRVREFQTTNGLRASGKFGIAEWAVLVKWPW